MTPDEFANQLCAALIREGVFGEDGAFHRAIHAAAKALFAESRQVKPEPEPDPVLARYGPFSETKS